MKRALITLLCLTSISLIAPAVAYAATDPNCSDTNKGNQILPCSTVQTSKEGATSLPTKDFKFQILPQAINIVLAVAGSVSVIVFVYAGVMLIIAQGNEEQLSKFKDILIWSIVGLLFITASYGLVRGIMQLVFR